MREILFQGKPKNLKGYKWVHGQLMHHSEKISKIYSDEIDYPVGVIPETVGQYTGLADNIGRKIFEGDIVSIGGHDATVDGLYCVIYDATNHCWALKRNTEHHHHYFTFSDLNGFADTSTVVGNIHDNPELLEVSE
jgi:uncharacterized phage protein (TIGR01671 family)